MQPVLDNSAPAPDVSMPGDSYSFGKLGKLNRITDIVHRNYMSKRLIGSIIGSLAKLRQLGVNHQSYRPFYEILRSGVSGSALYPRFVYFSIFCVKTIIQDRKFNSA